MTDVISQEILRQLLKDSRLSYREIARKIKTSVGTVINRINQLEADKTIK